MEVESLSMFAKARLPLARGALRGMLGTRWVRDRLAARPERAGVDPDLSALLRLDDLARASALTGKSAAAARREMYEQILIVDAPPPNRVSSADYEFAGPAGALAARLYEPADLARPSPGIVYIHGGGWVTGSIATHDALCRRFALGARARVVSLEYRRAPEHRFPAAAEDALAGVRWLLASAAELGIDAARVAVTGDSAGGNLTAVTSLRTRHDALRPKLAVPIYPATDGTCSLPSHEKLGRDFFLTSDNIRWYYDQYVPNPAERSDPDVSPLFCADPRDAPRTLCVVAAFDPLRDEGVAYAEKLRQHAVSVEIEELDDMTHGFLLMTGASSAARAHTLRLAERIGDELRA